MIDKILHSFWGNHHRFRHMTFDELSELYVSMMMRSLAMSMAGIFVPIFLFQNGYQVWQIFLFFTVAFTTMSILSIPSAYLVAKIGPKHSILISYFSLAIALVCLVKIEVVSNFLFIAIIYGLSHIIFFTAYHVDFSKVKHSNKGGKEISIAYITERIGGVMGPIIGGVVAFVFAPEYTFVVSIIVLLIAAVPLFFTSEPVHINQTLDFSKFKLKKIKSDLASYSFLVIDTSVSNIIWPLFLGIIIFRDNPYLQVGSITSIGLIISVIAARNIGKIIDNKKGRSLLRFSAISNSIVHILRPFTPGFPMALTINLVSEVVVSGQRMPYFKGMYDAADDHPGERIVYIALMEAVSTFFRSLFFAFCTLGAILFTADQTFFAAVFFMASIGSLLIMLERYPALKPRRFKLR